MLTQGRTVKIRISSFASYVETKEFGNGGGKKGKRKREGGKSVRKLGCD